MAGDPTLRAIIDSSGAAVGAQRFNAACRSMSNSAAATTRSLISFNGAVGGLALGLIVREIARVTREFIQAGDTFTMLNAKLGLFAQAGVQSTDILQALMDAANRAHAPVGDLADIYTRNAAALNNMGVSTSEQIRLTETLYKVLVISGNATESGKNALIQFSQSLNSGVFRGQEFMSVNEQATEILRAMGRATGKTQGELRKLANDGMITATAATNALLNDTQNIDAQFTKLPQTVEQASTRFADMFKVVIGESNEATGSNRALAAAIRVSIRIAATGPTGFDAAAQSAARLVRKIFEEQCVRQIASSSTSSVGVNRAGYTAARDPEPTSAACASGSTGPPPSARRSRDACSTTERSGWLQAPQFSDRVTTSHEIGRIDQSALSCDLLRCQTLLVHDVWISAVVNEQCRHLDGSILIVR